MLIKSKDVIGLKILSLNKGENVADVKDIVYDPTTNKVLALVVDNKGLFADAKVILFDDIRSIGKDNIMIDSEELIRKVSLVEDRIKELTNSENHLISSKVVTEDGNELGNITDIFFDSKTGMVPQIEISTGFVDNISHGKKIIEIEDLVTIGKDAIIVRASAKDAIEAQEDNGLEAKASDIKEEGKEKVDYLKDKVEEIKNKTTKKTSKVKDKVDDYLNESNAEEKFETIKNQVVNGDEANSAVAKEKELEVEIRRRKEEGEKDLEEKK